MAAFTAVAAGIGLAATAGGTAASFIQAGKQRKLQLEAEADAAKAMEEAKKKLDVNFYEGLAIQKEPYELERMAALSAGAQAIEAGREGEERGVAATAGRVQMAQNEQQAAIRAAMQKEMTDLEKLTTEEESRLQGLKANLDLQEAAGAQQAAAQAAEARQKAMSEGVQGITSMAGQIASMAPLYGKTSVKDQKEALSAMTLTAEEWGKLGLRSDQKTGDFISWDGPTGNVSFSPIKDLSNKQFKDFVKGLTPTQRMSLFGSKQFEAALNPFEF